MKCPCEFILHKTLELERYCCNNIAHRAVFYTQCTLWLTVNILDSGIPTFKYDLTSYSVVIQCSFTVRIFFHMNNPSVHEHYTRKMISSSGVSLCSCHQLYCSFNIICPCQMYYPYWFDFWVLVPLHCPTGRLFMNIILFPTGHSQAHTMGWLPLKRLTLCIFLSYEQPLILTFHKHLHYVHFNNYQDTLSPTLCMDRLPH